MKKYANGGVYYNHLVPIYFKNDAKDNIIIECIARYNEESKCHIDVFLSNGYLSEMYGSNWKDTFFKEIRKCVTENGKENAAKSCKRYYLNVCGRFKLFNHYCWTVQIINVKEGHKLIINGGDYGEEETKEFRCK